MSSSSLLSSLDLPPSLPEDKKRNSGPFHFKITHPSLKLARRLRFPSPPSYSTLSAKMVSLGWGGCLKEEEGATTVELSYVDREGDRVVLSSEEELRAFYIEWREEGGGEVVKMRVVKRENKGGEAVEGGPSEEGEREKNGYEELLIKSEELTDQRPVVNKKKTVDAPAPLASTPPTPSLLDDLTTAFTQFTTSPAFTSILDRVAKGAYSSSTSTSAVVENKSNQEPIVVASPPASRTLTDKEIARVQGFPDSSSYLSTLHLTPNPIVQPIGKGTAPSSSSSSSLSVGKTLVDLDQLLGGVGVGVGVGGDFVYLENETEHGYRYEDPDPIVVGQQQQQHHQASFEENRIREMTRAMATKLGNRAHSAGAKDGMFGGRSVVGGGAGGTGAVGPVVGGGGFARFSNEGTGAGAASSTGQEHLYPHQQSTFFRPPSSYLGMPGHEHIPFHQQSSGQFYLKTTPFPLEERQQRLQSNAFGSPPCQRPASSDFSSAFGGGGGKYYGSPSSLNPAFNQARVPSDPTGSTTTTTKSGLGSDDDDGGPHPSLLLPVSAKSKSATPAPASSSRTLTAKKLAVDLAMETESDSDSDSKDSNASSLPSLLPVHATRQASLARNKVATPTSSNPTSTLPPTPLASNSTPPPPPPANVALPTGTQPIPTNSTTLYSPAIRISNINDPNFQYYPLSDGLYPLQPIPTNPNTLYSPAIRISTINGRNLQDYPSSDSLYPLHHEQHHHHPSASTGLFGSPSTTTSSFFGGGGASTTQDPQFTLYRTFGESRSRAGVGARESEIRRERGRAREEARYGMCARKLCEMGFEEVRFGEALRMGIVESEMAMTGGGDHAYGGKTDEEVVVGVVREMVGGRE